MNLVVDASVALKWFMTERPDEQNVAEALAVAEIIERGGAQLYSPPHWIAEVLSVLVRLDPAAIEGAVLTLTDMNPVVRDGELTMRQAASIAVTQRCHLFDTLYHAVALETRATLVTADEQYFERAKGLGAITLLNSFRI